MPGYRLGIDLGGTKIEGVALDRSGRELIRQRIPTDAGGGYEHIVDRVAGLWRTLHAAIGGAAHTLGVGTPGMVEPATGLLKNSNTTVMNGRAFPADLAARIGRGFRIENDANCFALAEALHGAGRGHRVVFGVILGTGCGGGIVWDGAVHRGRNRLGGEWGHMSIDPLGPACYCGGHGCVETFISGSGLSARYAEWTGQTCSGAEVIERWRAGDPAALAVMEAFFPAFGRALANVIDLLDPDAIVLGGGLSNMPELYRRGAAELAARVFGGPPSTPLLPPELGDSAGVIGAALVGE